MLKILSIVLITAILTTSVVNAQTLQNTLPAAATPCILQEFKSVASYFVMDPSRYTQIAQVQYQGLDYYLLGVFPKEDETFQHLVVTLDGQGKCAVPFYNPHGDFMSFSPTLPEPVAQEFALQEIQRQAQERGGIPAYQKYLIQLANSTGKKLTLTPEERWAINRLGVRLPPNIKIDGPPKYPD